MLKALVNETALDVKVKNTANDTTPGYTEDKIVAGSNITLTKLNPGANERMQIASTASGAFTMVHILANYNASIGEMVVCDANMLSITLPLITAEMEGKEIIVKQIGVPVCDFLVIATAPDLIDGNANVPAFGSNNECVAFIADFSASMWFISRAYHHQ